MKLQHKTENHLVEFIDETATAHEAVEFSYNVLYSSFGCGVTFIYTPIDDEAEDDGRIACDVDVRAGGDCVGMLDVQACIAVAWEAHLKFEVAKRFRMTDG
jgi:hypothetical protein